MSEAEHARGRRRVRLASLRLVERLQADETTFMVGMAVIVGQTTGAAK